MVNPLNYSKWDHIDDSEDECDNLPRSIDKKSFQHYTKNKRAERDVGEQKTEEKLNKRLAEIEDKLEQLGSVGRTHVAGEKLSKEKDGIDAELEKMHRYKHWNAENMCHVVENRTIVNDTASHAEVVVSTACKVEGKDTLEGYARFCEQDASIAEEFIAMSHRPLLACEDFLLENAERILSEHAETYMMLDCLEKEMNGRHADMVESARQQQLVTQIREMARTLCRPTQDAVKVIFGRFTRGGVEESFQEQVNAFVLKVVQRARNKRKEMDEDNEGGEDAETDEDPEVQKVLDELPYSMVEAFRTQDIGALHEAVAALPADKGKYYLRRCEDVGLWDSCT